MLFKKTAALTRAKVRNILSRVPVIGDHAQELPLLHRIQHLPGHERRQLRAQERRRGPDVRGPPEARQGLAVARAAGAAWALHLAGGPHATAEPGEVLEAGFDLCALGEGEGTLARLLERLGEGGPAEGPGLAWREGAEVRRGRRPEPVDLDRTAPFPPSGERGGPIEITRGCVHACRFCQASFAAGVRLRHRSPEVVAAWAGLQVRRGRRDVRFVTPSALAYGSDDGSPRLDRVEALLTAVRAAVGKEGRIFLGTFPSELRPEHVSPEALRLLRRAVDNRALLLGAQSGSDRLLAAAHARRLPVG